MNRTLLFTYASALAIISIILFLIYITVQQSYRTGANDLQIQMARDIACKMERGQSHIPADSIDVIRSLSPFIVFYNAQGQVIQASGYLEGKLPQVSEGVLDFTNKNGEDLVTWQPRMGLRMAMAVKKTGSVDTPYVAVGRSLPEVENREDHLTKTVFIAWVACIIVLGVNWVLALRPSTSDN